MTGKLEQRGDNVLEIAARLDRLPVLRWHWKLVALCGLATFFDLYEIYMSGLLGAVLAKPWHLDGFTNSLLIAAPYFGMIPGAIFLGRATDRFGRRKMFMVNLGLYSLLAGMSAFAPNVETLIALRFATGIFLSAELILIDTYLSEFLPKIARGRMLACAYAIGWLATPVVAGAGSLLIAKTHFLMDGWRWMLLGGAVGAFFVFWVRRSMPESARWLAAQGRGAEADRIVAGIEDAALRETGRELPPVPAVTSYIPGSLTLRDTFRPPYLKRTAMLWIFQVTQTATQFGFASLATIVLVSKGYDIPKSLLFTTLAFIGSPIGALIAIPIIERFERKYILIAALSTVAVAGIVFGMSTSDVVIVCAGTLVTVCNSIVSTAWHTYQAELFPTKVRGTAGGLAYSLSRLTAGLLPFGALAILGTFGGTGVFVVAAAITAITCLDLAILGPRTNGRSLESVTLKKQAAAADGENLAATVPVQNP